MSETKHIPPCNDANSVPIPGPDRDEAAGLKLTREQILARRTNGVATWATAISVAGATLTGIGCVEFYKGNYALGVGAMAVGAACDAIDGKIARARGVDNYPGGRYIDIGMDGAKSVMVAGLGVATGAYPLGALGLTYGPKVAGWMVNGFSKYVLKQEPSTSPEGKVAEAMRWTSPAMFIGGYAAYNSGLIDTTAITESIGWAASLASAGFGVKALAGYLKSSVIKYKKAKIREKRDLKSVADPNDC